MPAKSIKFDNDARQAILRGVNQLAKAANIGPELMRMLEKEVLLLVLDRQWKDHLHLLDHLRHGAIDAAIVEGAIHAAPAPWSVRTEATSIWYRATIPPETSWKL